MENIKQEWYVIMALYILPSFSIRLGAPDILDSQLLVLCANSILAQTPLLIAIAITISLCVTKKDLPYRIISTIIFYYGITYSSQWIGSSSFGIFGGIISAVFVHQIFKNIKQIKNEKVKKYISTPIILIFNYIFALTLGLVIGLVYVYVGKGITALAHWILTLESSLSAMLFGILDRLLMPFNLNSYLHEVVWFGDYKGVVGDYYRFFAEDPEAGIYMMGLYPIVIFGLTGYTLLGIRKLYKIKRYKEGLLLLMVCMTSGLTGVSEILEMVILFLSPVIYLVHCLLTGISFMVCAMLNIRGGFSFLPGLMDYLLYGHRFSNGSLIILVGCFYLCLYASIYLVTYEYERVKLITRFAVKKTKVLLRNIPVRWKEKKKNKEGKK